VCKRLNYISLHSAHYSDKALKREIQNNYIYAKLLLLHSVLMSLKEFIGIADNRFKDLNCIHVNVTMAFTLQDVED
jgi:hypothetical protein